MTKPGNSSSKVRMVLTLSAVVHCMFNVLSSAIRLEKEIKWMQAGKDDAESTYLKMT